MTSTTTTASEAAHAANADRPSLLKLMQCRLWHRADWQYLGTRHDDTIAPWPIDSYRCERCARAWDRVN